MRRSRRTFFRAVAAMGLAGVWLLAAAPPSHAGCGCDHPPPNWALVMPPFGSPGKTITLFADGFELTPGLEYSVEFRDHDEIVRSRQAVAEKSDRLRVLVPSGLSPGPAELRIRSSVAVSDVSEGAGDGVDYTYAPNLFTLLAAAPLVPKQGGVYEASDFVGAVSQGGTLLIPFNLSRVLDATQFAFQFTSLPLTFGEEDVVFYNADGVDLTLFTLSVGDEVEHQWGSYYGWTVEDDTGLHGRVFGNKIRLPGELGHLSDILHYWRHEFHTYREAHAAGGSHEVDANGFHPDGTLHIDHDHLVLALQGKLRDRKRPLDESRQRPLSAGDVVFDLLLGVKLAENPVEPEWMTDFLGKSPRLPLESEPVDAYRLLDYPTLRETTDVLYEPMEKTL